MLAHGCRCTFERQRFFHERWCRLGTCGFFPWFPGCFDDDGDDEPHTVCLLEVQTEPKGFLPPSPHANFVDFACNYLCQRPTDVDLDPWIVEVVLRSQLRSWSLRQLDFNRIQFPPVGRWGSARVRCTPRLVRQGRQRILGCPLLLWQQALHFPNTTTRVVCAVFLHLGWVRFHVHWRSAGDAVAREAQEEVACNPQRVEEQFCLVFLDVCGMGSRLCARSSGRCGLSPTSQHFVLYAAEVR